MGFSISRIVKVFGCLFLDLRILSLILEIVFLHLLENDLQMERKKTFLGRCAAAVLLGKRREGRLPTYRKDRQKEIFPVVHLQSQLQEALGGHQTQFRSHQ